MTYLLLAIFFFLLYLLVAELYPVRFLRAKSVKKSPSKLPPLYIYSFELHIHTQFSYDSLGKPEDLIRSSKEEDIDFLIVTDHDRDDIRHFAGEKILAGKEVKLTDEKGNIMGDLLEAGNVRVVAHPFKEKYRWRLPLPEDYLFEIIDLKDALLERKLLLLFLIPYLFIAGLFSIRFSISALKRLVDIRKYALLYLNMGINNPVVAGLDHHVKVYVREVGVRFLFPDYRHSFRVLRNFLITDRKVRDSEDFLRELQRGSILISFSKKPTLFWKEGSVLKVLPPVQCILYRLKEKGEELYTGSYFELSQCYGRTLLLGYTYKFRVWNFYFGLT
ncbi:MAG: PHP domain-containing protein, partial [Aquificaceae bacterium]